jgi:hypothetical protein
MRIKGVSFAGRKARHARRFLIELLLEEDGEVVRLDITESDAVAHVSS